MSGNRTTSIAFSQVSKEHADSTPDARAITAALYEQFGDIVYTAMRSSRCHASDAEDITQTTFLRLYEALVRGASITNPRGWLLRTAQRLLIDRLRTRQSDEAKASGLLHRLLMRGVPTPEERVIRLQRQRRQANAVRAGLQTCTPLEIRCLRGRARGLTLQQIGRQEGLDHRRVAEEIKRAKQKLQEVDHA